VSYRRFADGDQRMGSFRRRRRVYWRLPGMLPLRTWRKLRRRKRYWDWVEARNFAEKVETEAPKELAG